MVKVRVVCHSLSAHFIGLRKYSQNFVISVFCDFDWSYRSYHKLMGLDFQYCCSLGTNKQL